jgi:hypothetical protein
MIDHLRFKSEQAELLKRVWIVLQVIGFLFIIYMLDYSWQLSYLDLNSSQWMFHWGGYWKDSNWAFLLFLFGPYIVIKTIDWILEAKI